MLSDRHIRNVYAFYTHTNPTYDPESLPHCEAVLDDTGRQAEIAVADLNV